MRRSTTRGRRGEHLVTDDRTGFTIWSGDARKEWNGAVVHTSVYEARHPQDYVRARRENVRVADARPPPPAVFVGPLITQIAAPLDVNLRVAPMGGLGEFALGQGEQAPMELVLVASNLPGSFVITVESTVRMVTYDEIGVFVDNGDLHRTMIRNVLNGQMLMLNDRLPDGVSAGNKVINYSAVAE